MTSKGLMAAICAAALSIGLSQLANAGAPALKETGFFTDKVTAGELAPIDQRLPATPRIVKFDGKTRHIGKQGGDLTTLIGRAKDTRLLVIYGYARLVGYDIEYNFVPDILESIDVKDERVFTLKLREGHKWSDGQPFTSEDFRYWWEDVANNPSLSPAGPPVILKIDGEYPTVAFPDPQTVQFSWTKPNPYFLPRLAGASPLFIYRPAHYLKQFHKKYIDQEKLTAVEKIRLKNWASAHNQRDNLYRFDNPDLPTLQPWRIVTKPPATRFIAERNPYYHRIDPDGQQLPYFDRVILQQADVKLIPAKAGSGETDLQARGLSLDQVPFLKQNEARAGYKVLLWPTAKGSYFTLYPNLNHVDQAWRDLFRTADFRRALSLAIDRQSINQALFFGLAQPSNNTVLQQSPLYNEKFKTNWTEFDLAKANALLDNIGLAERDDDGIRKLPDGRRAEIIIETAGENAIETDVLELISQTWAQAGIKLFSKPSQREVFRNRIFAGETQMSVWYGFENGIPSAMMTPAELAPTTQQSLQWPKWGQYFETSGQSGEAPDIAEAQRLAELNQSWRLAQSEAERKKIWHEMLDIHCEQLFTIGVVSGVHQPIVINNRLRNVPETAIYNWDPGAHFGIYMADTFWSE